MIQQPEEIVTTVDRRPISLNTKGAMALTGKCRTVLYGLLGTEKIFARKRGKTVLFDRPSLERYMNSPQPEQIQASGDVRRPITLNTKDAEAYTGLSRSSLYEALSEGRVSARTRGKTILFDRASLDAYVKSLPLWGTQ